jgi:hypothetical protein
MQRRSVAELVHVQRVHAVVLHCDGMSRAIARKPSPPASVTPKWAHPVDVLFVVDRDHAPRPRASARKP